jgi:hypothetical protein
MRLVGNLEIRKLVLDVIIKTAAPLPQVCISPERKPAPPTTTRYKNRRCIKPNIALGKTTARQEKVDA